MVRQEAGAVEVPERVLPFGKGMTIYINKNGQSHGPYNIDQVRAWLSAGQIQPTDSAWYEGGTSWVPVHTVPGIGIAATQYVASGKGEGWGLMIGGAICAVIGGLLSATVIGAILGIPLIIIGIIMIKSGRFKYNRRVFENLKESVRVGIVQGMQPQGYVPVQRPQLVAAVRMPASYCSNCATKLDADAKFCPSCAAPTS